MTDWLPRPTVNRQSTASLPSKFAGSAYHTAATSFPSKRLQSWAYSGYFQSLQPDEGTAAHIFQLSIVLMIPTILVSGKLRPNRWIKLTRYSQCVR